MFKVMNFSPHKLDDSALSALFKEEFKVYGHLPVVPDIGNYDSVKRVVKTLVSLALTVKPTHVFVSCHPSLEKLIHQCINQFTELHVPHIIWDHQLKRYFLAPPPITRQDRQDIEFNSDLNWGDCILEDWAKRMKAEETV